MSTELEHVSYSTSAVKFTITENNQTDVAGAHIEFSSEHLYTMRSFQLSPFQLLFILIAALECKGKCILYEVNSFNQHTN